MGKIYVGNLSSGVSETDLVNLFSKWGKVLSLKLLNRPKKSFSFGFAIIEMLDEEATIAARALDGAEIEGKALLVWPLRGC